MDVLRKLRSHRCAWPFMEPVDPDEVSGGDENFADQFCYVVMRIKDFEDLVFHMAIQNVFCL